MARISIITVCLNDKNNLSKTIESVLNQSDTSFQFIIKDGGSIDGTIPLIEEYKKEFSIKNIDFTFTSTKDEGVYDAMNQAIAMIHDYDYVLFLNAGDLLYNSEVIAMLKNIRKNDVAIYFGLTNVVFRNGRTFVMKPLISDKRLQYCHQSMLINSDILRENKYNTTLTIASDREYILRIISFEKTIDYINCIISTYNTSGISNKNYFKLQKDINEIAFIYEQKEKK